MDLEAKILRSMKEDLVDPSDFDRFFTFDRSLGEGSDGQVSAVLHRSSKRLIAVKIPHPDRVSTSIIIEKEAKTLKTLSNFGKHMNINHIIAYQSKHGVNLCPAIFLDYAEFGSLWNYRKLWCDQEAQNKAPIDIPESTVWKLFKDITVALDFLHNECGLIHRDVKTENILVARSATDYGSVVPKIPVFKLAEFSSAVAYLSLDFGGQMHERAGSQDFAPPLTEREANVPARPAGDMWSFGATLQDFALGANLRQSWKVFVEQLKKTQESHLDLDDDNKIWNNHDRELGAAYRPLNLQGSKLVKAYDPDTTLAKDYQPFSDVLNKWYTKLWVIDPQSRATSATLMKELIPYIDCYIGVAGQPKTHRTDSMLSPIMRPQAPTPRRMARMPSYEGNDYAVLSSELRLRELD